MNAIIFIIFVHGLGRLICSGSDALPSFPRASTIFYLIRRYPRLCVFAYENFTFLERVTSPSANPPFLEDQFVSLSLASLLRPVRLGRPQQEHKVPAGITLKVIEDRKRHHHEKLETFGEGTMNVFPKFFVEKNLKILGLLKLLLVPNIQYNAFKTRYEV